MHLYKNQLIRKSELLEQDITQMYQLMDSFYENINPKEFLRTLAEKDYIFLVRNPYGAIKAFTTMQLFSIPGKKLKAQGILIGDIISNQNFVWEKNLIWESLVRLERIPTRYFERYVFLACKDYWTYHVFEDSFYRCYPSEDLDTPIYMKKLMNVFGEYYSNGEYEVTSGIIKYGCFPRKIKKSRLKMMEDVIKADPDDCFLVRNPGFLDGDALVCVAELAARKQIEGIEEREPLVNFRA